MKKLNVAIIGQGRSGRSIHGKYFKSELNDHYVVKYVVDANEKRREIAKNEYDGCTVFENYESLYDIKDIDLVVNSSYSDMHYSITKDLLQHGKNVLVEKPMARNRYECDDLIKTAKENNVMLCVFQQTMLAPFYTHAKSVIDSGVIGEPQIVNIHYSGFSRRWDWQTLQKRMGGNVYNTGPHPLGLAMDFLDFGDDIQVVYSKLSRAMTSGDAEDIAKIILTAPGKPVVDIEINSSDAYSDYNLKVIGTKGTLKTTTQKYKYKYIVEGENPERPVIEEFIHDEEYNPIYCSEKLNFHEEEGEVVGTAFDVAVNGVYQNIYAHLTQGAELVLKPEMFAKLIGIIETVHAQNPLSIEY
ncbi:MAG: Gfo/Idh/MocA family oxidoreductase [Ruminococcaceae bacterium]|nr:Gfo/Idh/MocA family oxidoreductase [Oscillospiraceae bacterium]